MRYAYLRILVAGLALLLMMVLAGCQAGPDAPVQGAATAAPVAETPAAPQAEPEQTLAPEQPAVPTPAAAEATGTLEEPTPTAGTSTPEAEVAATDAPATVESPAATAAPASSGPVVLDVQEYDVPAGSHPHDVAPAADGGVWYTAQSTGKLGWLNPDTGEVREIPLGSGSLPHGVITGPDGAAWITDGGLNAIVRVDPETDEVTRYDLPADRRGANLNTAAFDAAGRLWFTGQQGVYGVLDTATGEMQVYDAPKGRGPYGITATEDGKVYYASLAGSYLGQVDSETGEATVLEPPTAGQGARRAWADSQGKVWVSEWNSGQLSRYDPATGEWAEWRLPGDQPRAYAVYVDWQDKVWLSDFGNNTLVRFDPLTEQFESVTLPSPSASVRQIHGREGEIWGAESSTDKLVVVRVR